MLVPCRPMVSGPVVWYQMVPVLPQPVYQVPPFGYFYPQGQMGGNTGYKPTPSFGGLGPGAQIECGGKIIHVGRFLGKGSFGTVFEADIPGDKNKYALKVLSENTSKQSRNNKTEVDNLIKANAMDGARQNIIRFYEHFTIDVTRHCLLVERLGESLADLMAMQRQPLLYGQIVRIARQVMRAVAHLNFVGLCHTDIKAANVLVDNRLPFLFSVKLADLGNAMPLCRLEKNFPVNAIQSIAYRAPEVYLGLELSCRIDVWSIGCLLAEMYVGQIIFPAENCYQLALFHSELVGLPQKYWRGKDYSKYYKTGKDAAGARSCRPYSILELNSMGRGPYCDIRDMRLTSVQDLYMYRYRKQLVPQHRSEFELLDTIRALLNPSPSLRPTPDEALSIPLFC